MTHPKHPRCGCGRPLFKAFDSGKRVTKSDPYRFCRNKKCDRSGPKGIDGEGVTKRSRKRPKRRTAPARPRPKPEEPELVANMRAQLSPLVKERVKGQPLQSVAFTVAMICQEAGLPEAADFLIEKHQLETLGLKKTG